MSNMQESWAGIHEVSWVPVLNNPIEFGSHYKVLPTEGYLAWEYNPLRNYRLSKSMFERDGTYYTIDELELNISNKYGITFSLTNNGIPLTDNDIKNMYSSEVY